MVPYHLLPFHALPFDGQPLTAHHSVSYLPSASTLQFLADSARPAPDSILAIGDPAGDLPAADVEARFVASLWCSTLGAEVTVRREIRSHLLLHFAAHRGLRAESPLASSRQSSAYGRLTTSPRVFSRVNSIVNFAPARAQVKCCELLRIISATSIRKCPTNCWPNRSPAPKPAGEG